MAQTPAARPGAKVLALRPMPSPTTGKMLGWTKTHALDCAWALGVQPGRTIVAPYEEIDVAEVPTHVGRCSRCGGGR